MSTVHSLLTPSDWEQVYADAAQPSVYNQPRQSLLNSQPLNDAILAAVKGTRFEALFAEDLPEFLAIT